ncbi:cysteinyl-tRNA synthetase [Thermobaculum terrenum ATCC BAA-798]|uniref:Cysteine--tRNA ligase n=1 Tax=Thermobaculum terrenum (strain ATCC BAA-798 / CCMEE 7001 / YNP1) TaxID=525904 RepID=D1CD70_THET1|nr:cysteinyl-tRNA synthetase [Thermobaculum terrenum ATCC BAA-798]
MLYIHNTLTDRKEEFIPLNPPNVLMYVCGPTVYGPAHIGHAMSYTVFDIVRRYLEYKGYKVKHVQNFTDVDDKIIARSNEEGISWKDLATRYEREFLRQMDSLNILRAHYYPRASEVIPEIIEDIQRLIARGYAYVVDGDVYFRVLKDEEYGELSHRRLDEMRAGARIEADPRKEHPMDFALWKSAKLGEPYWESPWGPGRPGWHIECTTMNLRMLGEQIDIHGGGADLIFPHHENEIAQSEAITGKHPFVRYWIHNGLLQLEEEKMARSVGNVLSIDFIVRQYGADAFRLFVLSSHYRKPLNFSFEALESAKRGVLRLYQAVGEDAGPAGSEFKDFRQRFESAMDDDFNTPQAIAVLFELARDVNALRSEGKDASTAAGLLRELSALLGLRLDSVGGEATEAEPFIDLIVGVRDKLRASRIYELSDYIRDKLGELGVSVMDTPEGSKWRLER